MVDIATDLLIVGALAVFEIVSSVDNAVINADVLSTMSERMRRWFLIWGVLISVFAVRGGLPLLIVYSLNPQLGFLGALEGALSADPSVSVMIHHSAPPLLIAGGVFLVFLFFHWLFLEPKHFGLRAEEYIQRRSAWFYAVVSVLLTLLIWYSIQISPIIAFGAAMGSSLFFVVHGLRENSEHQEKQLMIGTFGDSSKGVSELGKLLYLEVIDSSFSIDGVLGAFAFTFSVPLILIGNGIGAVVIRQLTARNIQSVKKYRFLKNGAMYSILVLGWIMILEAFAVPVPTWFSPLVTILILVYFFYRSGRGRATKNREKE